jgi:hypothetical protein
MFEPRGSVHLLSLPLWAIHGTNAIELAAPMPDRLAHLVRDWAKRYRRTYLVHTEKTNLCCVPLQQVERISFTTVEWERTYDRSPQRSELREFRFTISRVLNPEELRETVWPTARGRRTRDARDSTPCPFGFRDQAERIGLAFTAP